MGIHSKYALTAFIFRWSTLMDGPSVRKDSSVLFNALNPSLYPLLATSVCTVIRNKT
jgi:hypothetical protein